MSTADLTKPRLSVLSVCFLVSIVAPHWKINKCCFRLPKADLDSDGRPDDLIRISHLHIYHQIFPLRGSMIINMYDLIFTYLYCEVV